MQPSRICLLNEIPREQWQIAFNAAMAETDFDGLFDRLYRAIQPQWYTGPESARELALRLFNSAMDNVFGEDFPFSTRKNIHTVASGCLKMELRVYEENFQCHIDFDAVTAHGMSYIRR